MIEVAVALQEKSAAARWQALVKLNHGAPAKAVDAATLALLTQALSDEHAFVRWQASLALISQAGGRQKLAELIKNYPAPPLEFTPMRPELKTDLMVSAAIDALAADKSTEVIEALTRMLQTGDSLLRQSAAEALGKQGHNEAIPHLITVLKDNDPWVRRAAAIALGHLGAVSAATALAEGLKDKAVIVRRSAAYALGALRAEVAGSALTVSLTDPDPQVRRAAAWALGRIGRQEATAHLTRLLDDLALNGTVAAAASEAIAAISKPRWRQIVAGLSKRVRQ